MSFWVWVTLLNMKCYFLSTNNNIINSDWGEERRERDLEETNLNVFYYRLQIPENM